MKHVKRMLKRITVRSLIILALLIGAYTVFTSPELRGSWRTQTSTVCLAGQACYGQVVCEGKGLHIPLIGIDIPLDGMQCATAR